MVNREITCIGCPLGCLLLIEIDGDSEIKVTGNSCNVGECYGIKEVINPTRVITTTLEVLGGEKKLVSVKSNGGIPKDKILDCLKALKGVKVKGVIRIGDILYENIEGTGINIVATKNIS